MPDSLPIKKTANNVTVVALGPEYENLQENLLDFLQKSLLKTADRIKPPLLVLDLSHTNFFGSSFLEVLFRVWNRIKKRDGRFGLSGLSPYCREVIGVTQLDRVWEIFTNQDSAVAAFGTADFPLEA